MDEPFGAVDPIVRDRLQAEFLRLQREVRKTVLFVTHDLDEAVRLGDRIAVFREGGHLEQYDAPPRMLGQPGHRVRAELRRRRPAIKLLAVTAMDVSALPESSEGDDQLPTLAADATLRDAMIALLNAPAGRIRVLSAQRLGHLDDQ